MDTEDGQPTDGRSGAGWTSSRRWRRLQRQIDELTDGAAADVEYGWPLLLAWAAGSGLVVVALCRLVLTFTVNARTEIAVAGVAVVEVAALVCLTGLAWASWRIRLDATAVKPFGVALAISLVAIGVCTEAFAAATALLWRQDLITATGGVEPSLWRAEEYYLWHLIDSVPLVKIQDGVQWREPSLFASPVVGGLLLAYKVLVIGPLLRIGIGAYLAVNNHLLKKGEEEPEDRVSRKVLGNQFPSDDGRSVSELHWLFKVWVGFATAVMLALPVIIGLLMPLVFGLYATKRGERPRSLAVR